MEERIIIFERKRRAHGKMKRRRGRGRERSRMERKQTGGMWEFKKKDSVRSSHTVV